MKRGYVHHQEKRIAALVGALLGLGAPLGWLFWRSLSSHGAWLQAEIDQFGVLYGYMSIGTTFIFAMFGYSLGRRSDHAVDETDSIKFELEMISALAYRDALTGLNNARHLHDQLNTEIESAIRYGTPISCLMIDIDDFKRINDSHGHPFGDHVLSTLARTIKDCVRQVDIVGRLGGEEFLVIMPHTTIELALPVAERIRVGVMKSSITIDNEAIPVTISLGLASFSLNDTPDKSSLLKAADDALYLAKRNGKNRTVSARVSRHSEKT